MISKTEAEDYRVALKEVDEVIERMISINLEYRTALEAFRESERRISTNDLEAVLHKLSGWETTT